MENRRVAWLAWASISLLAILCGVLAVLQYRWIGEITDAERTRLHEQLQVRLTALSRTFNEEVSSTLASLAPSPEEIEQAGREAAYGAQFQRWRQSHDPLFRHIALAIPDSG